MNFCEKQIKKFPQNECSFVEQFYRETKPMYIHYTNNIGNGIRSILFALSNKNELCVYVIVFIRL